ncbi:hypothetical protein [Marinilactibacillus psychrotolerans]|uniref:hypothetical protein n=1 Tax=Marinilactibacillus psychrotolerans TaxID=191770 RepID=UPI003885336A
MVGIQSHKSIVVKTAKERERLSAFFETSRTPIQKIQEVKKNHGHKNATIHVRLDEKK